MKPGMSTGPKNNDFTIRIANVNGTGSASANTLLMKSFFRMGIPVVGKNYFPSNIQGLPTWYEIRANRDGYMSAAGRVDVMVAMNVQTYHKDLEEVSPGGILIYDSTWPRHALLNRDDITIIGVPLARMCNEHFPSARARILMKNVVYVGVLAALMDIDTKILKTLLEETFASKPEPCFDLIALSSCKGSPEFPPINESILLGETHFVLRLNLFQPQKMKRVCFLIDFQISMFPSDPETVL